MTDNKHKTVRYTLVAFLCGVCFDHWLTSQPNSIAQEGQSHESSTQKHASYSLAKKDSFGFFDDISDEAWIRKRNVARNTQHQLIPSKEELVITDLDEVGRWYTNNWHPYFTCPDEQLIGTVGDGHKYICDPHRLRKRKDCLVYSIGSDGEFSFEAAMYEAVPNCEIHIFDFGDYRAKMKKEWPNLNATFHQWGLKGSKSANGGNLKTIQESIKEIGHENRRIDIFKIDCEGCEWDSYTDWLSIPNEISQVLMESHRVHTKFFQDMYDAGYVLFHKEPNTQWKGGCEWAYLKLEKSFQEGP